jgi:hypothetical protein
LAGRVLLWVLGVWLVLTGLAYLLQRRLQYFPDASDVARPAGPEFAGLAEVSLQAADGAALKAWHWPGTNPATLLFLHGNAGHRGHRLAWIRGYHELGWSVFIVDYRGYGGSGGAPTQEGLILDAEAAAAWLADRGERDVVYVGESIGCGVAVHLAARRPPAAMVLHSGARSLVDVGRHAYPILPIGWIMKDTFDCAESLKNVSCPVLCVHGDHDRIIPMKFGRMLYDAASGPKEWYVVEGAGHNDLPWVGGRAYYEKVHTFLTNVVR